MRQLLSRRIGTLVVLLSITTLLSCAAFNDTEPDSPVAQLALQPMESRPRVALVLSSGGALLSKAAQRLRRTYSLRSAERRRKRSLTKRTHELPESYVSHSNTQRGEKARRRVSQTGPQALARAPSDSSIARELHTSFVASVACLAPGTRSGRSSKP